MLPRSFVAALAGLLAAAWPGAGAPAPGTARVVLGATNQEQGLRQVDHTPMHVSRVMTMGGRECRATNLGAGTQFALDFDVDDAFLHDVNLPVKVRAEYFDAGRDWFRLRYDSADPTALDRGRSKFSTPVQKADSAATST